MCSEQNNLEVYQKSRNSVNDNQMYGLLFLAHPVTITEDSKLCPSPWCHNLMNWTKRCTRLSWCLYGKLLLNTWPQQSGSFDSNHCWLIM